MTSLPLLAPKLHIEGSCIAPMFPFSKIDYEKLQATLLIPSTAESVLRLEDRPLLKDQDVIAGVELYMHPSGIPMMDSILAVKTDQDTIRAVKTDHPAETMPRLSWFDSAAAAKIGVPLFILNTEASWEYTWPAGTLQLNPDIHSPYLGKTLLPRSQNRAFGRFAIMRQDLLDFSPLQLHAIIHYLNKVLGPVRRDFDNMLGAIHKRQKKCKAEIDRKLTPDAFATFFEEYRRHEMLRDKGQSPHRWIETKCPVESPRPTCGFCGSTTTSDGKPLLECWKCQERYYCGKECMKAEYETHWIVCGKKFS